jgi:hypothetical protein
LQYRFHLWGFSNRNNQPRMLAENYDPKASKLEFTYLDATNLAKPEDGHMAGLTMQFPDKDHLIEDWYWKEGDQEAHGIFHMEREKPSSPRHG